MGSALSVVTAHHQMNVVEIRIKSANRQLLQQNAVASVVMWTPNTHFATTIHWQANVTPDFIFITPFLI